MSLNSFIFLALLALASAGFRDRARQSKARLSKFMEEKKDVKNRMVALLSEIMVAEDGTCVKSDEPNCFRRTDDLIARMMAPEVVPEDAVTAVEVFSRVENEAIRDTLCTEFHDTNDAIETAFCDGDVVRETPEVERIVASVLANARAFDELNKGPHADEAKAYWDQHKTDIREVFGRILNALKSKVERDESL